MGLNPTVPSVSGPPPFPIPREQLTVKPQRSPLTRGLWGRGQSHSTPNLLRQHPRGALPALLTTGEAPSGPGLRGEGGRPAPAPAWAPCPWPRLP